MLSRTADHLYWLARYVERAECLAQGNQADAGSIRPGLLIDALARS